MPSKIIHYCGSAYVRTAMAVVLRSISGHDWGWWSDDHQRMHIQTVEAGCRKGKGVVHFWLEQNGVRMFEPKEKGKLNADLTKRLRHQVEKERALIEDKWTSDIIEKGWVTFKLSGDTITIQVYDSHNTFTRSISIRHDAKLVEPYASTVKEKDMALDPAHVSLVIKRPGGNEIHIPLPDILWLDPKPTADK